MLTSILYGGRKRRSNVLIVASPGGGEGKTTVVSNLALAFAETNRSVLLIDCDTRKPKLHRIFDVPNDSWPNWGIGFAIAAATGLVILVRIVRAIVAGPTTANRVIAAACAASRVALMLDSSVDFDFYIPANAMLAAWIAGMGTAQAA